MTDTPKARKPAKDMTHDEREAELARVEARIANGFGEGSGSPGEWWYERADELRHWMDKDPDTPKAIMGADIAEIREALTDRTIASYPDFTMAVSLMLDEVETLRREVDRFKSERSYVVWSNEHKCWWGPNHAGYVGRIADAGRYTRDEALKICVNARGGRQFNSNPSEVPLPLADAEHFWPDDKDEWRVARHKHERQFSWEDSDADA